MGGQDSGNMSLLELLGKQDLLKRENPILRWRGFYFCWLHGIVKFYTDQVKVLTQKTETLECRCVLLTPIIFW